jgi:hypothetical protein
LRYRFFEYCPIELLSDQRITWKSIGYEIIGVGEDNREKKSSKVMYNETMPKDFFEYMKPKLKAFICQNYFTQWQNQQFHKDLEELPADIVLSCIDFSKNYNMKVQDEIQSMY